MATDPIKLIESAQQLGGLGKWHEAAALARQAVATDPANIEAKLVLGIALSRIGDHVASLSNFESALDLDPNNFAALNLASMQCHMHGDPELGIGYGRRAMQIQPNHPEPALNLGICYSRMGRLEEAHRWIARAVRAQPNHPDSLIALANVLRELGRGAEAVAALERAMAIKPTQGGLIRLMDMQLEMGHPSAALETGERAVRSGVAKSGVHLRMARAHIDLGDELKAEHYFDIALETNPADVEAYLDRGFWQQSKGAFREAELSFEQAIKLEPSQGLAYFGIANSREVTEDDRPMIESMRELISAPSTSANQRAHLLYALGKSYDNLGEPGTAIEYFDQANALYRTLTLRNRPFDPVRLRRETDQRILCYASELFQALRPIANRSDLPILVLGMMRSGTTLVEQILSRHPQAGGAGEIHFWAQRENTYADANRGTLDLSRVAMGGNEYVELLARTVPTRPRVIDKNPSNVMLAGLIHAALPNARIIHTLRDPADTALSMWITHVTQPPEFCCDRNNIVAMYREYRRLAEYWRAVLPPDRYLEVSYEELVSDPETNIRRMISFLGLDWSELCLHPEYSPDAVKTPSGWQVRQPIYKSSVGRWRQYEQWIPEFVQLRQEFSSVSSELW